MIDLTYIASPSFSGSTLLTVLLGAHRSIATVGELKWGDLAPDDYRCSCGAVLNECAFWRRVEAEMQERDLPFNLARPATEFRCTGRRFVDRIVRTRVRGPLFEAVRNCLIATLPSCQDEWTTIVQVNKALIQIITDLQAAEVFLDASKDPVRLKHLIDTGDYRTRVIQLVRDGRGVTYSTIKNQGWSAANAALEWRSTYEQIERVCRRLDPGRVLMLRYEDLCVDVAATLKRVFEFVGVDPDDFQHDTPSVDLHVLGNRMRLQPLKEIRLDETWKSLLSAEDRDTFSRVGGSLNRRFGYE